MSVFVAIEQLAGLPSVSVVPANLSIASFSSATTHLIHIDGPAEDLVDFGHSVRRVSLTIASTDMSYTATKHLPITVLSNDLAGVTVNSTSMMVTEGGCFLVFDTVNDATRGDCQPFSCTNRQSNHRITIAPSL
eukprot:COSAG01_NODE_32127_length_586_cov_0.671458_1_plen_134_part_00